MILDHKDVLCRGANSFVWAFKTVKCSAITLFTPVTEIMDLRGLKKVEINSQPHSMILFIRPQKRQTLPQLS